MKEHLVSIDYYLFKASHLVSIDIYFFKASKIQSIPPNDFNLSPSKEEFSLNDSSFISFSLLDLMISPLN